MISETEFHAAMAKAVALIDAEIDRGHAAVCASLFDTPMSDAARLAFVAELEADLASCRVECIKRARAMILNWRPDGDGEPVPIDRAA